MNGRHGNQLSQSIEGNHNQVAGNDIINEGDGFRPDPNNPNLMACHQCDWPGLSRLAITCPKCGYDHAKERQEKLEQQLRKQQTWNAVVGCLMFVWFVLTVNLSARTDLNIAVSGVTVILVAGSAWIGWCYVTAHIETWVKTRKQRGS